jgi:hypothetical protein
MNKNPTDYLSDLREEALRECSEILSELFS